MWIRTNHLLCLHVRWEPHESRVNCGESVGLARYHYSHDCGDGRGGQEAINEASMRQSKALQLLRDQRRKRPQAVCKIAVLVEDVKQWDKSTESTGNCFDARRRGASLFLYFLGDHAHCLGPDILLGILQNSHEEWLHDLACIFRVPNILIGCCGICASYLDKDLCTTWVILQIFCEIKNCCDISLAAIFWFFREV